MYTSLQMNSRIDPMHGCAMAGIIAFACSIKDALPIVHGPTGCAGGYRLVPLLCDKEPLLPTTAIYQYELVMGTADKLKNALYKAHQIYQPKYIFVTLTCATSMSGEDYSLIAKQFEADTGTKTFILDGSALFGEESDGYAESYRQFVSALNLNTHPEPGYVALDGLSPASFGAINAFWQISDVLTRECGLAIAPSISVDFDAAEAGEYAKAHVLPVGQLFHLNGLDRPLLAPVGIKGTFDFMQKACALAEAPLPLEAAERYERLLGDFSRACEPVRTAFCGKAAMVEADGFYAYWLARFLHDELQMEVFVSTDEKGIQILERENFCKTIYADMGGYELDWECGQKNCVLAFGSTNLNPRGKGNRIYIPYSSPCWDDISEYPTYFGYDGAFELLVRIK
ncbi:MAG: nitrogenase component 1, partial [Bacillota bacterium]